MYPQEPFATVYLEQIKRFQTALSKCHSLGEPDPDDTDTHITITQRNFRDCLPEHVYITQTGIEREFFHTKIPGQQPTNPCARDMTRWLRYLQGFRLRFGWFSRHRYAPLLLGLSDRAALQRVVPTNGHQPHLFCPYSASHLLLVSNTTQSWRLRARVGICR